MEVVALVVVVANGGVCECAFVVYGWCARDVQVSEARVECTFLANDAALVRAVIQLRCCGNVFLGCGLLSCVVRGVSSMEYGFRQSSIPLVSSPSPSLPGLHMHPGSMSHEKYQAWPFNFNVGPAKMSLL
eukprot:COSAG02_NODE_721_length_18054_cov_3.613422_9_plen_130_part_00